MQNDGNTMLDAEIPRQHGHSLNGVVIFVDPVSGSAQRVTPQISAMVAQHTAVTHVGRWVADHPEHWHDTGL